ncbi:MAG: MotA/TolQ/ExbB proton channel family protein [Kiritimatiellae bacterium]|nr:MotA/TolQ/ExbB proton channel family protein [Kiritimatiellia bacterium]
MLEIMQKGGPMMWLILVVSFIGAAVFLAKLYELHRAQIPSGDFLKGIFNILNRHNIVEAVSICEETPGPVASVVRAAILHHDEERPAIAQAIEETGLAEIPRLERRVALLATVAQLAPVMGLLGTVIGMIRVLLTIEQKAPLVHAGDVLGGLWQALLAAAAGLAVGIPAYAGYNFLVSRVESILLDMERAAADILTYLTGPGRRTGA